MVDEVDTNGLRQTLERVQYGSVDSTPPKLSHPLPHLVAPQLVALSAVMSLGLTLAFNKIPVLAALFPEGDLYFTRYDGSISIPFRIFLFSFYLAFASFIHAPRRIRLAFALELILPFLLLCATLDLCNVLARRSLGVEVSLLGICMASALTGMLNFGMVLLACADMPARSDSPMRSRFKIRSFVTLGAAVLVSAAIALWIDSRQLALVRELRDVALLGGVSAGVFLFIPMLVFLLNVVAACQNAFRPDRSFSPPVSVVLPAYNEAHVIGSTIAALNVAASRYRGSVTLLVVDNNSSDRTQEAVLDAFAKAGNLNGVLLKEMRRGKAFALNRGLDEVTTAFFARVDADTLLQPDALARAFSYFGCNHTGAVGGLAVPPGGGPFDGPREIEILLKLGYDHVALGAADCIVGIPGMFACYDTEAARRAGGFAVGMNGEDTDMAVRIGEDGYRLIASPHVVFFSEVPRSYAHLREQRHRWFRSLYHVAGRNRQFLSWSQFSGAGSGDHSIHASQQRPSRNGGATPDLRGQFSDHSPRSNEHDPNRLRSRVVVGSSNAQFADCDPGEFTVQSIASYASLSSLPGDTLLSHLGSHADDELLGILGSTFR